MPSNLYANVGDGLDVFRSLDLDETEEEVKAGRGSVFGYFFYNAHASDARYLKFYNATAAATSVGTTVPLMTFPMKAGTSGHIAFPDGIKFDTAISVAATTGLADNDTGAPSANDVIVVVWYA